MSQLRAFIERKRSAPLWNRVRQIVLACVALGAVGLVGCFVNEREPVRTWLFFPYAGFCAATIVWVASCTAFGHAALRLLPPLGIRFRERLLFDFATGVLLFAVGLFVRGTVDVLGPSFYFVYPLVLLAVGGAFSFADARRAWRHFRWARRRAALRPSIVQHGALMLATVGFGIVYLTIMVPENVAFDARSYHLPIAEHFAAWGHVGPFPEGWYGGALPHLASWLYTWPFTLDEVNLYGHVELCAHLELALFVATVLSVPLLVEALCPGRRARGTWAVFFLFPGLFLYDSSLGIAADHVLGFWAAPLALAVWRYMQRPAHVARGVLAGLMVAGASLTKYQSIYLVVPGGLAIAFASFRELARDRRLRTLAGPCALLLSAAAASAPHWLANVVWYGNPVFPLALDLFPSSHPVVPGWAGSELDHQFEVVGTLPQRLEKTLRAVFTFSFVPNDWWSFHRDIPVFGFLFTMTLPILLVARGGPRDRARPGRDAGRLHLVLDLPPGSLPPGRPALDGGQRRGGAGARVERRRRRARRRRAARRLADRVGRHGAVVAVARDAGRRRAGASRAAPPDGRLPRRAHAAPGVRDGLRAGQQVRAQGRVRAPARGVLAPRPRAPRDAR
jgi:hypothetical protein